MSKIGALEALAEFDKWEHSEKELQSLISRLLDFSSKQRRLIDDQSSLIEKLMSENEIISVDLKHAIECSEEGDHDLSEALKRYFLAEGHKSELTKGMSAFRDLFIEERKDRISIESLYQKLLIELMRKGRTLRIDEEIKSRFCKMLEKAPRFSKGMKKGRLNYRGFEKLLMKEFPNGINGKKFAGDGKYAKWIMENGELKTPV